VDVDDGKERGRMRRELEESKCVSYLDVPMLTIDSLGEGDFTVDWVGSTACTSSWGGESTERVR